MPADAPQLPWTDEQWATIQRVVQESANKTRVASSFLPLVGPLPPGQASVPALWMRDDDLKSPQRGEAARRLEINDAETLSLATISCEVHLTTQQAEDPELASARQMLGRAAAMVGRVEDAIVFKGQPKPNGVPIKNRNAKNDQKAKEPLVRPAVYQVQGGAKYPALVDVTPLPEPEQGFPTPLDIGEPSYVEKAIQANNAGEYSSKDLIDAIVSAVDRLETNGHHGPFACVLGSGLYKGANIPAEGSLILPSDRIVPFLDGGPLRRSSLVDDGDGVVVALAGSPVDLVVASDVHVKFLQISLEPRYVLRVSERLVLRIKQPSAICRLSPPPVKQP